MLKLNFNTFWERVKQNKANTIFPIIHCMEEADRFTFIFRAGDQGKWKYFTIMDKENLRGFAEEENIPFEEVLKDFRINYCSDTVPLEPDEFAALEFVPTRIRKTDQDIIDPGQDIIEESEDYADFMLKVMAKMEKKVLDAVSKIPVEKSWDNIDKTFGEFIRALMNSINTIPFAKHIRTFVKSGVKSGLESAEEEVGVDIGFTTRFNDKVDILTNQQLNGYTMPDGKAWHGIKGASKDLQVKILKSVQEDVINKKSHKEMAKNIQEIFEGSGFSQAVRIARTESNRFINEGKLAGYQESGIPGTKAYAAVGDSNTSDICLRLDKKYFKKGIPFDEEFVDDVTGKHGMNPPFAHPNCRCALEYRKS
jgi:SPP1 gp7 family putative phage head morphogenesis protein